jgi:hypothetical protein
MNRHDQAWQRLSAAARRAPEGDVTAPFGFATRVVAHGFAGTTLPTTVALLEKFAWRGFVAAMACSLAAAAFGYSTITADPEIEVGDTVTEVLAQS